MNNKPSRTWRYSTLSFGRKYGDCSWRLEKVVFRCAYISIFLHAIYLCIFELTPSFWIGPFHLQIKTNPKILCNHLNYLCIIRTSISVFIKKIKNLIQIHYSNYFHQNKCNFMKYNLCFLMISFTILFSRGDNITFILSTSLQPSSHAINEIEIIIYFKKLMICVSGDNCYCKSCFTFLGWR